MKLKILFSFYLFFQLNCGNLVPAEAPAAPLGNEPTPDELVVITGAERLSAYLPTLKSSKGVALIVNQTSQIGATHLVDSLLSLGVPIKYIFAPEHGFRGQADAGEKVKGGTDTSTGLPIISLYGKNKKPSAESLNGIDWVVFDIQDVGARFYTYISTMHYAMEACAEQGVSFMVLDRPNPNGHYVDGPILQSEFSSFVGLHPVPVVHGMTVGEYAQMINGEGWLKKQQKADLRVVECDQYSHKEVYELPIPPSPNLPNMLSIYLYPSLCFFEGTNVSVGRGTNKQFQVLGHPAFEEGNFTFTPQSMPGAKYPKHEGLTCRGYNLSHLSPGTIRAYGQLNLNYLIQFYEKYHEPSNFFLKNGFFDKLAGTDKLRKQIIQGATVDEIRKSWQNELQTFKEKRKQYLLYEDF